MRATLESVRSASCRCSLIHQNLCFIHAAAEWFVMAVRVSMMWMWGGDLSFRKCRNKHMCRIVLEAWFKVSWISSLHVSLNKVRRLARWLPEQYHQHNLLLGHILYTSHANFVNFLRGCVSSHKLFAQSKTWNISNQNTTTNIYNYQHETPLLSYHCRDFHRCQYWYRVCCCKYIWLYWPVAHMM
jgi:hypothetical protein